MLWIIKLILANYCFDPALWHKDMFILRALGYMYVVI